MLDQIE